MTLDEFAAQIGVSPTTVSRALSGRGRVGARTRQMIRQRVDELGYTPNLHAQRLAAGRSQTIAMDWGEASSPLSDPHLSQLFEGVQVALQRHGYGLLLCGIRSAGLLERLAAGSAVDGAVIVGDDNELGGETTARRLAAAGTPCVVIGHHAVDDLPGLGAMTIDLADGAHQAAHALADAGHTEVGFLASHLPDRYLDALLAALGARGIVLPEARITLAKENTPDAGADALTTLLQTPPRPTVVIARTDILAAGALRAARRQGLRVPDDLSVIGHDDLRIAALLEPPLTTLRIDYGRLGEQAAEILLSLIASPERRFARRTLRTELILRDTLKPPPSVP
jgi:LacI family transcriptional regulator